MRVILALMVMVSALQQRAEACSCSENVFFANGPGIPTNVRIPILGTITASPTFSLATMDGAVIPTTTEAVPGGFFVVPSTNLQPNTDYVLEPLVGRQGQSFRTGEGVDEFAPVAAPILGPFTRNVVDRGTCGGPGEVFSVQVSEVTGEPTVHEVFVGPTTKTIDTSAPAFFMRARSTLFLSEVSICEPKFPTSSMPDLAIAIRTRDLAGNVSPLSNAIQLKTAGCSATGGPTFLLLATLGMGLRPRRRRG